MVKSSPTILNIAHRGARAYAPENTLVAFAKASAMGCQMVELDVRLSKDHQVIVYHDDQLTHCTDVAKKFPNRDSYKVTDFTLAELEQLDAGSWYVEQLALRPEQRLLFLQSLNDSEIEQFISPEERAFYASGNVKIPTLTQVLQLAKELDLQVNIELKSQSDTDTQLVEAVLNIVQTVNMSSHSLISAFNHDLLREVRRQSKHIATAALTETPIKAPVSYLRNLKVTAYHLQRYKYFRDDAFNSPAGKQYLAHIAKIRKADFAVNIWTCNDPDELSYLLTTQITGLVSDYPNRVSGT